MSVSLTSPSNSFEDVWAPLERSEHYFKVPSQNRKKTREILGTAYDKLVEISLSQKDGVIPTELEESVAKIFYLYSRILYGGDMFACINMLKLSLAFQMKSALKISQFFIKNLPNKLESEERNQIYGAEAFKTLCDADEQVVVSSLAGCGEESTFLAGCTVRWFLHSCQCNPAHMDFLNVAILERIFNVAIQTLNTIGSRDSNWEVAEILCLTRPYIYNLKTPNDTLGGLETLTELSPYLEKEGFSTRSQTLRALIMSTQALAFDKLRAQHPNLKDDLLKGNYELISKAHSIAEETEDFDPYLRTQFRNYKGSIAALCRKEKVAFEIIDDAEIGRLFDLVLADIKASDGDHFAYGNFMVNAAKAFWSWDTFRKALDYLVVARSICDKYPDQTKETVRQIQALVRTCPPE